MKQIGLHEPFFIGNEKKYLIKCIDENRVSSSGRFLKLFQSKFKKITKGKFLSPVLNGTVGLHISMLQSGVKENDEGYIEWCIDNLSNKTIVEKLIKI